MNHLDRDEILERLRRSAGEQARLEERILRIENSLLFRATRATGGFLASGKSKLGYALLRSPLHRFYLMLRSPGPDTEYANWVEWEEARLGSFELQRQPLVSIIMPVHLPRRAWLQEAVESVIAQSYPHWQLCICDDGSREDWIVEYLSKKREADPRIAFTVLEKPAGISAASNEAGKLARGEYIAFLDHDDTLHPSALHYIAEACQDPEVEVIYSDEDYLDENGARTNPSFKPDWSPDLLTSCMYFGHLFAARRESVERAGWLRGEYDGAQDHDLALRLTDGRSVKVRHVPRILYHWRRHGGSTASGPRAKPHAQIAGRKAVEAALARRGVDGSVNDGPLPHTYAIRRKLARRPLVSLVICSRNPRLLRRCLRSIANNLIWRTRDCRRAAWRRCTLRPGLGSGGRARGEVCWRVPLCAHE